VEGELEFAVVAYPGGADDVAEQGGDRVRRVLSRFDGDVAGRAVQVGEGLDHHLAAPGEAQDDGVAEADVVQLLSGQHGDRPFAPRAPSGVHVGDHHGKHGYLDRLVVLFVTDGRTVAGSFIREP
jgi:hypothetical protein